MIIEVKRRTSTPEPYDFSFLGYAARAPSRDKSLAQIWRGMMRRCYDKTCSSYHLYGAKGITVHRDWHTVENFIQGVKLLPNYNLKNEDWDAYSLDKDYYGSDQYGPKTCVWLDAYEQAAYTSQARPIVAMGPYGQRHEFLSVSEATRFFEVSKATILAYLKRTPKGNNYCKKLLGYTIKDLHCINLLRRPVLPFRNIIAIDLEATGLDPKKGHILEVSAHLLDSNLEIVDSIGGVFAQPENMELDDFVLNMHTANGLLDAEPNIDLSELATWFSKYPKAMLLGSSVNFDQSWLLEHIPNIDLHHRVIDVSSFKELVDITGALRLEGSNHRAYDDIMYSIKVARIYKEVLNDICNTSNLFRSN